MNLWLGAAAAVLCAVAGAAAGWSFSRLPGRVWALGYLIPLTLVLIYALANHYPAVMFVPPLSWLLLGLKKFAIFGFIITMLLTTPLSRLPQRRNRVVLVLLMVFAVLATSVWPFVAPMVDRNQLSHLKTQVDRDGVCIQSTDYTCGPAAAVTVLLKLGLAADEGHIAILSCTSEQEGTPVDMLADALNREYAKDGLSARGRSFHSVAELKGTGPVVAVIKYGLMVDHWVAVLNVTDTEVVIGDPLGGLDRMTYADFAKRWRFVGIVLERNASGAR